MKESQKFFNKEQCSEIEQAIEKAEQNCSGEIRVHIDRHCSDNVLDDAAQTFAALEMHKTELRNGVLFYIAYEDKKYAVIGDVGINMKVPAGFWDDVCEVMGNEFRRGEYVKGLLQGIEKCGRKLKEYFPYKSDDINELPNEVSFGKK